MNFDPAITAWQAFMRVQASNELGGELDAAVAALGLIISVGVYFLTPYVVLTLRGRTEG